MDGWTVPSLALLRGTTVGATDAPEMSLSRVKVQPDGTFAPIPREQWIEIRMEEQMDAMLYLGPKGRRRLHRCPPPSARSPAISTHALARMALNGIPQFEADRPEAVLRWREVGPSRATRFFALAAAAMSARNGAGAEASCASG